MRKRQRNWRLMQKGDNTETGLHRHDGCEDRSAGKCALPAPGVVRVQYRRKPDYIGDEAVLELNRERVFEKIARAWLKKPEQIRN